MKHSTFVESGEKSEYVTIQTGLKIMLHGDEGQIDDSSFASGIQFLIKEGIISVYLSSTFVLSRFKLEINGYGICLAIRNLQIINQNY